MSEANSFVIIPFALTFLLSVRRFYFRDSAGSIFRPSFLMAFGSVVIAAAYLLLGALKMLPEYSTLAAGIVGLLLLGVAVWQMFQL